MRMRVRLCGAALLGLAGCGGGGGGGGDGGGGAAPTPGEGQAGTGSALPPRAGVFGGGQGRILYVQGGDRPQRVQEFDLATRQSRDVVAIARTQHHYLAGGVSRAQDGSFLVIDKVGASLDDRGWFYHCAADGTILHSFESPTTEPQGATISPDGRLAAYGMTTRIRGSDKYEARVVIVELATGAARQGVVLGGDDEPRDKILNPPRARTVWASDGNLYVITRYGLFRIDPATAAATRLHSFRVYDTGAATISPDGATIWFESEGGTGGNPALWSVGVATGGPVRRVERSRTGLQYAPVVSPDGQWLLMQQVSSSWTGVGTSAGYFVCAVRNATAPQDVESQDLRVFTAAGEGFTANGRMAWS